MPKPTATDQPANELLALITDIKGLLNQFARALKQALKTDRAEARPPRQFRQGDQETHAAAKTEPIFHRLDLLLSTRELTTLALRLGIGQAAPLTRLQVAEKLGITVVQVKAHEDQAFRRCYQQGLIPDLRPYFERAIGSNPRAVTTCNYWFKEEPPPAPSVPRVSYSARRAPEAGEEYLVAVTDGPRVYLATYHSTPKKWRVSPPPDREAINPSMVEGSIKVKRLFPRNC